ncbi:hypothetical protein RhiirA1_387007 [Rhizophagus irregularis]|uniref:Uncharacterized protein n=1 Tax=Rhizophagus irregularis TaxID=588596 RepID=A0A2N0SJU1_9GLOM|nr:hypothetical protein RhiirA1_387007 [Rhizophagus irregularis]
MSYTFSKMKSLLKATSQVELNQIFLELEKSDKDGVKDGIKSQIKRQAYATNRKGKRNQNSNEGLKFHQKGYDLPLNHLKSKSIVISDDDSDEKYKSSNEKEGKKKNNLLSVNEVKKRHEHLELEIEERKMDLKEREVALRKAEAEVEAIEFANERMKLDLEKSKT